MRELPAILVALAALAGCAADRAVGSTMTLAPGQTAAGSFWVPDGGRSLAQFWRELPRKGVRPYPEATTWNSKGDDGAVLLAFPGTTLPEEHPMGYAQQWMVDGGRCRVVVRNASDRPATFTWVVTGSSDAVADWDLSGGGLPR